MVFKETAFYKKELIEKMKIYTVNFNTNLPSNEKYLLGPFE